MNNQFWAVLVSQGKGALILKLAMVKRLYVNDNHTKNQNSSKYLLKNLSKKSSKKSSKKYSKKSKKRSLKKIYQKICQNNSSKIYHQTSRNQHQVTPSNTKVTNSLDGGKRRVISVLRNSARPANGRPA